MDKQNRRRRYWINPGFQGRYLRAILLLELIAVALTAILALGITLVLVSDTLQVGPQWHQIFLSFAGLTVVAAVGLVWLGIRVSHRICGPIYNIKKNLDAVRNGERPGPIRLRKGDAFQDLAESLNEVLAMLDEKSETNSKSK